VTVHRLTVTSLSGARDALTALGAAADDVVLVVPEGRALVAGSDADVVDALTLGEGAVVVGAAPDPKGSGPYRSIVEPTALLGRAGALTDMFGALPAGADDGARLHAVADDFDLVLDSAGQVFRVLDGSGGDIVAIAGRFHAGNERPIVAIGEPARLQVLGDDLAENGGRDLAALLRYDGAAADGPLVEVAPDIVVTRFWTPEFCALVVRAAEVAGIWGSDPTDPVPGAEVSLFSIAPRLVAHLEADMQARLWPRLRGVWPEVAVTAISDAFVIRHEPATGGAEDEGGLPLHHDVAQVSASIRLRLDGEGGELTFPRQQWDSSGLAVGDMVAWPSLVTHPHRTEPVRRGVIHALTIWFALPDE